MVDLRGVKPQRQVAVELNIPVSTYAMVESGRRFPRKDLQVKLARYFGVTVDELFFENIGHETRANTPA